MSYCRARDVVWGSWRGGNDSPKTEFASFKDFFGGGEMIIFPQKNVNKGKKVGFLFHSGPNPRKKWFLSGVYDDFLAKSARNFSHLRRDLFFCFPQAKYETTCLTVA